MQIFIGLFARAQSVKASNVLLTTMVCTDQPIGSAGRMECMFFLYSVYIFISFICCIYCEFTNRFKESEEKKPLTPLIVSDKQQFY